MNNRYENIPEELKRLKRWVLWKKRDIENGKTTKVPICAFSGFGAKSNDESTWANYDVAINKIEYYNCDGLGFMLGDGIFGIDIDHAIDNKELIEEFINTMKSYTEKSQSGEGIHIICKGTLPVGNRRKGNIEMYDNTRFFVMTGNNLNEEGVNERTEEVKGLYEKYLNPIKKEAEYIYHKYDNSNNNFVNMTIRALSDDEVIQKAKESKNGSLFNCLINGQWDGLYDSQSQADASFCSLLAFWTNKNPEQMDRIFRQSGLMREKWDSKRANITYGKYVINNAINLCKSGYVVRENEDNSKIYNPQTGEILVKKKYDLNDTGNAQRFIDKFGENVRYNFDNKYWMIYDGKTWIEDEKQLIKNKADLLIEEMKAEAFHEDDKDIMDSMLKNIKHLSSNGGKEAMLKEAMHMGKTAVKNNEFDLDLFLLNCENGVVNLKTGEIMPHDKKYMLSRNTHIDIDTEHDPKLWIDTIKGIFGGSDDMVEFIQKALGYTITGSTKEQCLFQCYGDGSNGKSLFFRVLYECLGTYALNTQIYSLIDNGKKNGGSASPDIARMNGARFVISNEPKEGVKFDEGLVKQLTGGDTVTARFLFGKDFDFRPIFKLWIACNHKIIIRGTDKGIWRRNKLIPFNVTFEGKNNDKDREEKVRKELPQILGWIVKGCLKWQKEGLGEPKEIQEAINDYKKEMDVVLTFIESCCKINQNGKEKAGDMFKAYKEWAKLGNEYMMSQTKFGIEMGKKFKKIVRQGYGYYQGVILKSHDTSYTYYKDEE